MAILHDATLTPSKVELLAAWLPGQAWYPGGTGGFDVLGRFRFDDPAGAVGMETFLLGLPRGVAVHVPLTYRGAAVPELVDALVGTLEHSVLGPRWVYDAAADPVYQAAAIDAIRSAGGHARQFVQAADGTTSEVPSPASAIGRPGSGPGNALRVVRRIDRAAPATDAPALLAAWPGQETPVVVATIALS